MAADNSPCSYRRLRAYFVHGGEQPCDETSLLEGTDVPLFRQ